MKKLTAEITLIEPMLGTSPNNETIYRDFIGSKAPADFSGRRGV